MATASKPGRPADQDPAVTVCFVVSIDDESLGAFNSCEGLGVEVVMEQREEGGNNGLVWQLPTRVKYSNIKLSRPISSDTNAVIEWLTKLPVEIGERTATIEAKTADGTTVATWELVGVVPVKWSGPSLSLDSPKVATETLEIAHHGFSPRK
jgi:phage tail-like protein